LYAERLVERRWRPDNVEYQLAGGPYETGLAGETRLYKDNVAKLLPALQEQEFERVRGSRR
jgi:hypothetical protein